MWNIVYVYTLLEKATATHSNTLAWRIPWMEEPGGYSPWGLEESDVTEQLHSRFSISCTGEGNGNPLQYSCLEDPRVGGAWWAAIYGVAQSWTRLKRFSSSSSSSSSIYFTSSSIACLQSVSAFGRLTIKYFTRNLRLH